MEYLNLYFVLFSLFGLAILTMLLTSLIVSVMEFYHSWVSVVISWIIPIFISILFGNTFNLGFLSGKPLVFCAFFGWLSGLISNGLYNLNIIKIWVKKLESKIKKGD